MRNAPTLLTSLVLAATAAGCRQTTPLVVPAGVSLSRFAADVVDDDVLGEYPRPTMRRDRWLNLNGFWEVAVAPRAAPVPTRFEGTARVPFAIESPLSGVGRAVAADQRVFYRRRVTMPSDWAEGRVLLHFGAVDWECEVTVGGRRVGWHRGGYDAFTCDVTDALVPGEPAEIVVAVWDPTDRGGQPRGDQSLGAGTAVTGIWQTVWLEPVPAVSIDRLHVVVDGDTAQVRVDTRGGGRGHSIRATAVDAGGGEVTATARFDGAAELVFDAPRSWSPEDPFLYDLHVELQDESGGVVDAVSSACGLRTVTVAEDESGVPRIHLNGRPVFWRGVIDDGTWPGGGPTAPTDAALVDDLRTARELGFQVVRKRGGVASERWYHHCDRLGLVVFQDMPAGTNESALDRAQWQGEFEQLVRQRSIHPSVVMWVPFDQDRGAHDVPGVVRWLRSLDPTRLVDVSSGGADGGVGDVIDVHGAPAPLLSSSDPERALVVGSFGGIPLDASDGGSGAAAIEELWRGVHAARDRISAAIWARLTDGVADATGLRTRDRSTLKVGADRLGLAHAGLFPPTLAEGATRFFDATVLELASDRDDVRIRYTIDGALPDDDSPLYDAPLAVTESCVLTARAFFADGRGSWPSRFELKKIAASPALEDAGGASGLRVTAWVEPVDRLDGLATRAPAVEWVNQAFELGPTPRSQAAALVFEGTVSVPRSGFWRFSTGLPATHRLLIDGELVADDAGEPSPIALQGGAHRLRLELLAPRDIPADVSLSVEVEGPDHRRRPIPAEWLHHDA